MFNHNLMIEDVNDIEIMELESKFNYDMGMNDILFMESGNGELYIEGVIDTVKEFIVNLFNKVREAISDAISKLKVKIAKMKIERDYKKIIQNDIDIKRLSGAISVPDERKIKETYDEIYKTMRKYYIDIDKFDLREDNVDEFIAIVDESDEALSNLIDNIDKDYISTTISIEKFIRKNDVKNLDATIEKVDRAHKMYLDRMEKESLDSAEKVERGSNTKNTSDDTMGVKNIAKLKMNAIKSHAAKTAKVMKKLGIVIITLYTGVVVAEVVDIARIDRKLNNNTDSSSS